MYHHHHRRRLEAHGIAAMAASEINDDQRHGVVTLGTSLCEGLLSGTNLPGDVSSLLMSSSADPKPRLRWTPELHQRFVDAVLQLGGADSKIRPIILFLLFLPFSLLYVFFSVRSFCLNHIPCLILLNLAFSVMFFFCVVFLTMPSLIWHESQRISVLLLFSVWNFCFKACLSLAWLSISNAEATHRIYFMQARSMCRLALIKISVSLSVSV